MVNNSKCDPVTRWNIKRTNLQTSLNQNSRKPKICKHEFRQPLPINIFDNSHQFDYIECWDLSSRLLKFYDKFFFKNNLRKYKKIIWNIKDSISYLCNSMIWILCTIIFTKYIFFFLSKNFYIKFNNDEKFTVQHNNKFKFIILQICKY